MLTRRPPRSAAIDRLVAGHPPLDPPRHHVFHVQFVLHDRIEVPHAIRSLHDAHPRCHVICGLSNISFGLPARQLLNRCFLAQAMLQGLDAAILDPTDTTLMALLSTARVLLDRDEYCQDFIEAHQSGRLA